MHVSEKFNPPYQRVLLSTQHYLADGRIIPRRNRGRARRQANLHLQRRHDLRPAREEIAMRTSFPLQCLRTWLERQQSCPTCRQAIVVRRGATPDGQVRVGQQANEQDNDGNGNNAAEEDANVNAPGNREVDASRDNEDGGNQNSAEPAGEAQPNTLPVRTSVNQ